MGTVFFILLQFFELLHQLIVKPPCQNIIRRIGMGYDVIPYLSRINVENRAQRRFQIFLVIHQYLRIQNNIVYFVADCQNRTVGIQYFSTFKRYCHRIILKL